MSQKAHAPGAFVVVQRWSIVGALQFMDELCSFPVFAAMVFACMVYFLISRSMVDPDIWWHLRDADIQWSSHSFLSQDLYSFTAHGAPWINHEWLSELPFYLGWRLLGARGVFLVTVLAIEAILLGVFYLAYKKSQSIAAAMVVSVLAAFASTISFGPRTLLFGWICLVLELLIIDRFQEDLRYLWTLPPLFLFWVNLHGSWVIGMVLLLIFTAGTWISMKIGVIESVAWPWYRARLLMIATCISICALFVNPYGWRLVGYPFDLAFRQKLNIGTVEEWHTLDFHSLRGKVFLTSIGLLFVLQLLKVVRWRLYDLALVLIGIYSAVTYSRFLFLGAILIMPLLARSLSTQAPTGTSHYRGWMGVAVLLAIMPFIMKRFSTTDIMKQEEKKYPFGALPLLRQLPPDARVFNEFAWGGFLEWNVRRLPMFIDSRVDIFEYNGTLRDYLDVIDIKNPLGILDRRDINYVLFERYTPLTYLLERNAAWKIVYQDETTELLQRIGLTPYLESNAAPR